MLKKIFEDGNNLKVSGLHTGVPRVPAQTIPSLRLAFF